MTPAALHRDCAVARSEAHSANEHRGRMSYHAGLAAEELVAHHFTRIGKTIAATRWRGKRGEIDLVLKDCATVLFVEVKQSRDFETALSHVTPAQVHRLYATGEEYLGTLPNGSLLDVRFDVALVDGQGAVQIFENAFGHDF